MSDIVESLKDAFSHKRRDEATVPTYDAQSRGPYREHAPPDSTQPQLALSSESRDPGRAEQTDLSSDAASGQRSGSLSSQTLNAAEQSDRASPKAATTTGHGAPEGTYGPHKSRIANALDPRVDSDCDGRPSHGLSDYGDAAGKPVHKEGGKFGLS